MQISAVRTGVRAYMDAAPLVEEMPEDLSRAIFTSWYVHHTMRYSDGWMSLHSRKQLIYALNPH